MQCDIGSTTEIARGFIIESTIEYPSLKQEINHRNLFKKFAPWSVFIIEGVILINNSTNLKQEKT